VYVPRCEINKQNGGLSDPAFNNGIRIVGCDGFYGGNGIHLQNADVNFEIAPDGTTSNDTIASIKIAGGYMDKSITNGIKIVGTATAFRKIEFVRTQIREAGEHGVYLNPSSQVTDFYYSGIIDSCGQNGLFCDNANVDHAMLDAPILKDNNTDNTSGFAHLSIDGSNWSIISPKMRGGGANGTSIIIDPDSNTTATNININGGDLSQSTMGTKLTDNSGSPSNRVRSLSGYNTKDSFTATQTSGTTTSRVSHGLDVTPLVHQIVLTAQDNLGTDVIAAQDVTSTDFRLVTDPAPTADLGISVFIDTEQ
jgi:hypothetical protein